MLRDKMLALMNEIDGMTAERTELIRYIAIALLTRKNLFILGGTGQAKSYVVDLFRQRIEGARQFKRLLTKGSDEEQLFGRPDLSSLIPGEIPNSILDADSTYQEMKGNAFAAYQKFSESKDAVDLARMEEITAVMGRYRRSVGRLRQGEPTFITTGKIPESDIVFLDECYKANDGLLNSLLTVMNEREYTNEGVTVSIPTISFFGASNEIPNFSDPAESILRPLHDRFELKVITEYVQDRDARLAMLRQKQNQHGLVLSGAGITLEELTDMQEEVKRVSVPPAINEVMDDILCELRRKGVHISDLKYFGFTPIVQAQAWLDGRAEVQTADLLALDAYLWTSPEELPQIRKTLSEICENPLGEKLDSLRTMALEAYDGFEQDRQSAGSRALLAFRSNLLAVYRQLVSLRGENTSEGDAARLEELHAFLEDQHRKACAAVGFTYLPLSELEQMA